LSNVNDSRQRAWWVHDKFDMALPASDVPAPEVCRKPEVIRFDVEPEVKAGGKPAVRIFLSTNAAYLRAARVFVWSVKKFRDPGRVYEVFLLSGLTGTEQSCRGAMKHAEAGRIILNRANQIYCADPGELFDRDMAGAGVLVGDRTDQSTVLADCDKMTEAQDKWAVISEETGAQFEAFVDQQCLLGRLDARWAADGGDVDLRSAYCLSVGAPKNARARKSAKSVLWDKLEREADVAKFTLFSRENTSVFGAELIQQYQSIHNHNAALRGGRLTKSFASVAAPIKTSGATTILDYGSGKAQHYDAPGDGGVENCMRTYSGWPGVKVRCFDPGHAPFSALPQGTFDGVISTDVVEHLAPEDVPWVLDEMFSYAEKFVYVIAACYPAKLILPNGLNAHTVLQPPAWWREQMMLAGRRHPGTKWVLGCERKGPFGKLRTKFRG
jgi:hypothetical protein